MSEPGKSITLEAPLIKATAPTYSYPIEPTPSRALGTMLRHLKGVMAAAEELRSLLEKQEQSQKEK
jgi:hypothetical protein